MHIGIVYEEELQIVILLKKKITKSLAYKDLAITFVGVTSGARTHDIQNHNLTL